MRSALRLFLIGALLAGLPAFAAGAQPVAGRDYQLLSPPQPTQSGNKVEVLEFFWYGCPHCNSLQPPLKGWLKKKPADVEFRRVPAVLSDGWIPLTRVFFTLEALGLTDRLHDDVFAAIHDEKVRLQDPKRLFDWVAGRGVDRKKFMDAYNSFGVQSRVQRSIEVTRSYQVPFTPVVVVDGRYLTAPSMTLRPDNTVDYGRYLQVLDQVIAMARESRARK